MRGLCRRMTVLFWALAAVAAAISLVFMEDIRILISCGLLSAVLFLWSRLFMRAFQRELLDFTDGICAQMDRMMDGPAWGETGGGERGGAGRTGTESAVAQESLFGKILQKLERLVEARDSALRKMTEERDSLQRLISDIAHQTKTPLANLKLLGERLSGTDRERGTEGGLVEGELFAGQIDKLDFLIQAMVKTSRMESGMIRLVKKEQSLLETVVQAMNGVLEAADEKGMNLDLQCPEDCRLPHDRKWTAEALFNIFDYSWQIGARQGSEEQVEQALENVARSHREIALETFEERVAWGEASFSFLFHILQGLASLIALLGVVNLINTTLSNQISRQREISAMRCVGLTNRQLGRMAAWEGVSYAALSILVTVAAGLPLSLLLHRYSSLMQYSRVIPYEFPFLYMGIYGAVLLGLECILSVWIVKRQKKQPLIEQLRSVE